MANPRVLTQVLNGLEDLAIVVKAQTQALGGLVPRREAKDAFAKMKQRLAGEVAVINARIDRQERIIRLLAARIGVDEAELLLELDDEQDKARAA